MTWPLRRPSSRSRSSGVCTCMCSTLRREARRDPVDGLDELGALALADVVPALAVAQLVRVPLPPDGDVVLAGRGDRVVEGAEGHGQRGRLGRRQAGAVLAVRAAQGLPARGDAAASSGASRRCRRRTCGSAVVPSRTTMPMPLPVRTLRCARAARSPGAPSPSRSTVVSTWQPATTSVGRQVLAGVGEDAGDAAAGGRDRRGAVAEADAAAVRLEPALQRLAEHAAAALGVARRLEVHDGVPADEVGGGDLVRRRAGLRAHPGQRRLEPLVVEVLVEQAVGAGEELPRQLEPVEAGRLADAPQRAAEVGHRRRALEGLEDPEVAGRPVQDEGAVGVGVLAAADLLDRGAGAVEVDEEVDALAAERREAPRVEVLVLEADAVRSRSSTMPVWRTMMWALEPRSIR